MNIYFGVVSVLLIFDSVKCELNKMFLGKIRKNINGQNYNFQLKFQILSFYQILLKPSFGHPDTMQKSILIVGQMQQFLIALT
jgi:hypothetical protein